MARLGASGNKFCSLLHVGAVATRLPSAPSGSSDEVRLFDVEPRFVCKSAVSAELPEVTRAILCGE
jgi:hypothetical protein